jgi:hypothetical protein
MSHSSRTPQLELLGVEGANQKDDERSSGIKRVLLDPQILISIMAKFPCFARRFKKRKIK